MAVLAEAGGDKVRRLAARVPSIDVLGVNAYGEGLLSMPDRVRAQGWTGPIVVSELGALGQWQAGRTAWGAALEPSSTAKADALRHYVPAIATKTAGHLLFLWGHKQEVTPTWHSLLLESGEWTEAAEAMAQLWNGMTPGGNRAPRIVRLATDPAPGWRRSEAGRATLEASDPDGDAVAVEWTLLAESTDLKPGGDAEAASRRVSPGSAAHRRAADRHQRTRAGKLSDLCHRARRQGRGGDGERAVSRGRVSRRAGRFSRTRPRRSPAAASPGARR